MSERVQLALGGKVFEGWKSVSIKRSMKSLAGSFELSVTDKWTYDGEPVALRPGEDCEIRVGGELLITGYLDSIERSFSTDDKSISVSGRDKAGDLVDCSVDGAARVFNRLTVDRIIKKLAAPFGISVLADVLVGEALASWAIQEGESVYENIARAARARNFLVISQADGSLLITRAKSKRSSTELRQGENILAASSTFDAKELFSKYTVKGHNQMSADDDAEPGEDDIATEGSAQDQTVPRYRPLIISKDSKGSNADAKRRAQWEATVRQARSVQAEVEVYGWRQLDGRLWQVNELVKVNAPWIGIQTEMLVTDLDFSLSSDGTKTKLTLEMPNAYLPEPVISEGKTLWGELNKVK